MTPLGPVDRGLPESADHMGRMRALARYAILDTPPDEAFDDLAHLARELTGKPIAGIGFFEMHRVWFKSLLGAAAPETCTPGHLLGRGGRDSSPPGKGALALSISCGGVMGVPCVTSDGFTLGCLFVAAPAPFTLEEPQSQGLESLARQVVRLLELRRTLLSYHTVVDGAGHVVFHLDQADELVSLTPTWSQLSGFGVVRSHGARLQDFLHPDDRDRFAGWLDQVRTTAVPPVAQCRLVRLTQDEVQVELLARPLVDEGGRLLGVVGVMADVSERHARELEAQHLQKLEALGRLSAGLAHEINTPIQFVGDNARFLAESYEHMLDLVLTYRRAFASLPDGTCDPEQSDEIHRAEVEADLEYLAQEVPSAVQQSIEGVERVASLVRAMKTFSHPGAEEQAPADLNEALGATLTVAQNQFRYIAQAELDLAELPPVTCNIGDLNQVFLNIVINAADAIRETGTFGTITVRTRSDGQDAVITISDTGTGVPEALQRQIFEPFFTTKLVGHGTGQGLALVRAVVERHAGSISLTSEQGIGSAFTIRLPVEGHSGEAANPS